MLTIIGLGNPGEQFEETRHNAGFMAVDFFAKKNGFPDFELEKKFQSMVSKKGKIIIAKPQTFMNNSGLAVKKITALDKKGQLVVVHDDIDLPLGRLKIVQNRGSAGHKGVESIIKAVGNKNLVRIRFGVQPAKGKPKQPEKFVVQRFTDDELKQVRKTAVVVAAALDLLHQEGVQKAMGTYN